MERIIEYAVGNLIPGVVISVIAAYATVRFSLRRFRAERWWEAKTEAYSKVIESLHHMKRYCSLEIRAYEHLTTLDQERRDALISRWREAADQISLAADVGSYMISKEAVECLEKMEKGLDEIGTDQDWYSYIESQYVEIKRCLEAIRGIAKQDLKVK
jgi:type I site-specific restriction endonuclease